MKWEELDEFTKQYIATALWSSWDENNEPLDSNYDQFDLTEETIKLFFMDCRAFQNENSDYFENGDETAGHDFWLTRNGHGAGFWDGDYPEFGDILTKKSEEYGVINLYVGDDGKLYC